MSTTDDSLQGDHSPCLPQNGCAWPHAFSTICDRRVLPTTAMIGPTMIGGRSRTFRCSKQRRALVRIPK